MKRLMIVSLLVCCAATAEAAGNICNPCTATWVAPSLPAGQSLSGYRVYAATTAGGPYQLLLTLGAPAVTTQIATLVNGTQYFGVVTAVDTSNRESANSTEVPFTFFVSKPAPPAHGRKCYPYRPPCR